MKRHTVKVGTQFYYCHADGKPLWTVIQARGRGTWIAEVKEDEDWAGTQKAFTSEEIQASLSEADFWKESRDESTNFYHSLKPGSVVHYSNGFNQYVRCQVMPDKQLLPIALVGAWREYDLPKRQVDGTVYNGYHADQILQRKTMQPHASNVWEFPGSPCRKRDTDPTGLAALDLSVPPATKEQDATAKLWQTVNQIREAVRQNENPKGILKAVELILNPWTNDMGQTA